MKSHRLILPALLMIALLGASCLAEILSQGTYSNVYQTVATIPDNEDICDPAHSMSENIATDDDAITRSGSVLRVPAGSVSYSVDTGYIPMEELISYFTLKKLDKVYRGKIPLFGSEYYLRNISADEGIVYACRGAERNEVYSTGFSGDYKDYQFQPTAPAYGCYEGVCGFVGAEFYVKKPDGTIVETESTVASSGTVDDLEIAILTVNYITGDVLNTSFIVFDRSTEYILEDGENVKSGFQASYDWTVEFETDERPFDAGMDIACYEEVRYGDKLLASITLTNSVQSNLSTGESLALPAGYILTSDGTGLTVAINSCPVTGDYYPCGEASVSEVVRMMSQLANGDATISQAAALINLWANL